MLLALHLEQKSEQPMHVPFACTTKPIWQLIHTVALEQLKQFAAHDAQVLFDGNCPGGHLVHEEAEPEHYIQGDWQGWQL